MGDSLTLQSSLPDNEVDRNFENVDVFEGIMDGLHEALAHKQGDKTTEAVVRKRTLPDKEDGAVSK